MRLEALDGTRIFVVHDYLTATECDGFIAASERTGYEEAPITTAGGFVMRKDIRDNTRVIVDDIGMAQTLFERAKPLLPAEWNGWRLLEFNERFRYYRYDPTQKFALHTDGCFLRTAGERSFLTFMIYLNDGFEGGATAFHGYGAKPLVVTPQRGMALVFDHVLPHEGQPIVQGRKYVLRTDVMYRR